MKENLALAALAAVIMVVGVLQFIKDPLQVTVVSSDGETQVVTESLGAVSGPELNSSFFSVNGNKYEYRSQPSLTQGNAVVCSFAAPSATSTLVSAVFKTATSTNYTAYVAKASSATATTTILSSNAETGDGELINTHASSTWNAASIADLEFSPGQYLNFAVNSGINAQGSCAATFNVGGTR